MPFTLALVRIRKRSSSLSVSSATRSWRFERFEVAGEFGLAGCAPCRLFGFQRLRDAVLRRTRGGGLLFVPGVARPQTPHGLFDLADLHGEMRALIFDEAGKFLDVGQR